MPCPPAPTILSGVPRLMPLFATTPNSLTRQQVDEYFAGQLIATDAVLDAALADSAAAGLPPIQVYRNGRPWTSRIFPVSTSTASISDQTPQPPPVASMIKPSGT